MLSSMPACPHILTGSNQHSTNSHGVIQPPGWFALGPSNNCLTGPNQPHCVLQVAIAIGMLALMDQQLTGISWVYDGTLTQYHGRNIRIQYCMFSSSTDESIDSRCNFGFAVASVSLVLSFIWSYLQVRLRHICGEQQHLLCRLLAIKALR